MGLKDEIEKLIATERAKIGERESKDDEYSERQCARFANLRVILNEIAASVNSRYLSSRIGDQSADLKLGTMRGTSRDVDIHWHIEPNSSLRTPIDPDGTPFVEKPGFKVETTHYFHQPIPDELESTKVFEDEQSVSEHLVKEIAKRVAQYQRWES